MVTRAMNGNFYLPTEFCDIATLPIFDMWILGATLEQGTNARSMLSILSMVSNF